MISWVVNCLTQMYMDKNFRTRKFLLHITFYKLFKITKTTLSTKCNKEICISIQLFTQFIVKKRRKWD